MACASHPEGRQRRDVGNRRRGDRIGITNRRRRRRRRALAVSLSNGASPQNGTAHARGQMAEPAGRRPGWGWGPPDRKGARFCALTVNQQPSHPGGAQIQPFLGQIVISRGFQTAFTPPPGPWIFLNLPGSLQGRPILRPPEIDPSDWPTHSRRLQCPSAQISIPS